VLIREIRVKRAQPDILKASTAAFAVHLPTRQLFPTGADYNQLMESE
jgi:hypothetical protein